MTAQLDEVRDDRQLQRVLWACYEYWRLEDLQPDERAVCYSWVVDLYEDRFDKRFHQSKLSRLEKLRFLEKAELSRSGHRRYYKISNPEFLRDLLSKWMLL